MNDFRIEQDLLGERPVPAGALHGIHTERAIENFPLAGRPVHPELIHAFGAVKLACARTNRELGHIGGEAGAAIEQACGEMADGALDAHIKVDALQGGAGTSTNMNVNEVLANRALAILGRSPGSYDVLSPDIVNLHQSTNDTYPTALRIAAIRALRRLEGEVVGLLEAFQGREKALAGIVKVGRTELQDAVLTTLGRSMGAFAEAFARDRWRVQKCEERLRVVNLGGTAIGTGIGAPRRYIFRVVEHLRAITNLGLARAENLVDATQNTDAFVEVSGILKALAADLLKVASDLRLMASGPDAGLGEIALPARQAGSSIMPGKVNPVIPEAVTQAAIMAVAYDQAVTAACASGALELNAFMPLIADALLAMLDLLARACGMLARHCVEGIAPRAEACARQVGNATAVATALVEELGYAAVTELARAARDSGRPLGELAVERGLMTAAAFEELIAPARVMRLGSTPGKSDA
ncbi:MAG TPA: aspartate ammonia-lyase [Planctomycetes bacterium]|nr:aspartate ammonia-lyase [Planctomycetota bacterium]